MLDRIGTKIDDVQADKKLLIEKYKNSIEIDQTFNIVGKR